MPQPFNNAVITQNGAEMLLRSQAGEIRVEFTRIAVGSGSYTEVEKTQEALHQRTGLKEERNSYALLKSEIYSEHSVKTTALITNQDPVTGDILVNEGYYINEMGLYAKEKDGGEDTETLYSIVVTAGDRGDFMPPYNGYSPTQIIQDYYVTVSNSAEVSIYSNGAVVLAQDFEAFKKQMIEAISKMKADLEELNKSKLFETAGAGAHNSFFRGKFLGDSYTDAQKAAVAAGTFDDMYIGDYWTIGGVNWRIAHFDYWMGSGSVSRPQHHVVIVPDTCLYKAQMHNTASGSYESGEVNATAGGYMGSDMYKTGLDRAKTAVADAFGATHIVSYWNRLVNAAKNGRPTKSWLCTSTVELMNELMVYGSRIYASSSNTPTSSTEGLIYDETDKTQLMLFALRPDLINCGARWWLRDVVSDHFFAMVHWDGSASSYSASNSVDVRPVFGIC